MNYNEIYLTHIRLINFQSWRDMTLELGSGLNVVVADNGVGKSVIFKSITASILPDSLSSEDREDYIRHDADFAQVMYFFNDNTAYIINVSRYENSYYFIDDVANPKNELLGSKPPQDLMDRLGVVLRGNYIGNLINMQQDLFLVESDASSDRSIINLLMCNENLDTLIYELENIKLPTCKDIVKQLTYKKNGIDATLKMYNFKDVGVSESNLEVAEELISGVEPLVVFESKLEGISKERPLPGYLNNLIDSLEIINKFADKLSCINEPQTNLVELKGTTDLLESLIKIKTPAESIVSAKYCEITNVLSVATALQDSAGRLFRPLEIPSDLFRLIDSCEELWKVSCNKLLGKEIDSEIDLLKAELKEEEGEEFGCPIYGRIRFVDQECIPCD